MAKLVKLHRSRNHRMIGGVVGGMAEYLGWSPFLSRVLFVGVSVFTAGVPGTLVYVILWLMMPKATDSSYE